MAITRISRAAARKKDVDATVKLKSCGASSEGASRAYSISRGASGVSGAKETCDTSSLTRASHETDIFTLKSGGASVDCANGGGGASRA